MASRLPSRGALETCRGSYAPAAGPTLGSPRPVVRAGPVPRLGCDGRVDGSGWWSSRSLSLSGPGGPGHGGGGCVRRRAERKNPARLCLPALRVLRRTLLTTSGSTVVAASRQHSAVGHLGCPSQVAGPCCRTTLDAGFIVGAARGGVKWRRRLTTNGSTKGVSRRRTRRTGATFPTTATPVTVQGRCPRGFRIGLLRGEPRHFPSSTRSQVSRYAPTHRHITRQDGRGTRGRGNCTGTIPNVSIY